MPVPNEETQEFWKKHIEAVKLFSGSAAEYCRQKEIDPHKFYWYKKRLAKPKAFAQIKVSEPKSMAVSKPKALPDPKWLAQFLVALGSETK